MKKIVFGITSLQLGGAERVLVDLANALSKKYDITIFTLYGNGEFESQLNTNISLVRMYKKEYKKLSKTKKLMISLKMIIPFLRKKIYNKYLKGRYDLEISFLEGPITWIFSTKSNTKKIVWIHNDIKDVFGNGFKSKQKNKLNKKCYEMYEKLVFVSKDNLNRFQEMFPENKTSKLVIYNYLNSQEIIKKSAEFVPTDINNDKPSFLQVSRIVDQKGLFRLLEVHKKLIQNKIEHYIYVIGDGTLYNDLNNKIKEYKLDKTFILLGKKENPYPYIKNIDNFLLTSFYEGYGMVVVEAEILNKSILITDTAAREALQGYSNGMIVSNDEDGIYNGINSLINKNKIIKNDLKFDNSQILIDVTNLIEGDL